MSLDIIIPVYNSSDCIIELNRRLQQALSNETYHIIFINDRSSDDSWVKLEKICSQYGNTKAINLSKNYGQDCAIMAGLNYAKGDYVVIMDDDLQHDPEDIMKLVNTMHDSNYDVCYANFENKKQSFIKNRGSWFNGKVANIVIKKPKDIYLSPFKVLRQSLVKRMIDYDGPYPYIDGLIFRYTAKITQITMSHHNRYAGKGNFSLIKSISVWLRVLTNFSIIPLRVSTYVGILSSFIGFILGIYFIVAHFLGIESPEGWPSLIVSILFIGGIQLMGLGIIGEYVGRSFLYQSKEPQFIIKDVIGKIE